MLNKQKNFYLKGKSLLPEEGVVLFPAVVVILEEVEAAAVAVQVHQAVAPLVAVQVHQTVVPLVAVLLLLKKSSKKQLTGLKLQLIELKELYLG